MTIYEYNRALEPDLQKINSEIILSAMTDKDVCGSKWSGDSEKLQVCFTLELSAGDKAILDGIISGISEPIPDNSITEFIIKSSNNKKWKYTADVDGVLQKEEVV